MEALRALGAVPEARASGALAFWAVELAEVTGWWLLERDDGALLLGSPDGRTWPGVSLERVARLLEGEGEA